MATNHKSLLVDAKSARALELNNLRLALVNTDHSASYERWVQADTRGFNSPERTADEARGMMDGVAYRRVTGVYDDSAADPDTPVGTVSSWPGPLTVPGSRAVQAWAISSVTVSPTHRRRGIARAMLEAELRTAVASGVPLAMLTVSEATIYERFGFAPAAMAADLTIDTRRARWVGTTPSGRVHFVERAQLRRDVDSLVNAWRIQSPGEILAWPRLWDLQLGLAADDTESGKHLRAIRYDDENGQAQGFAIYKLKEDEQDYSRHTATLTYLLALTPDAYSALWQHMLELDLTATVKAPLRSVDEPLLWQVDNQRAIEQRHHDHLWLRILDVVGALSARSYAAPLDLTIAVTDDLDFAAGTYRVRNAVVEPVDTATPDLTMPVNSLSALYLGGVSATTLRDAGRITEHTADAAAAMDTAFRSPVTPWLSLWF